ncbi:MAG: hypothetical protein UV28_C0003G0013 [Candidatus Collierbacteria bacterium GW2011_GWE2_42_48]|nr:MAG: hypothetical protein UV28_C0003G0013 [Candidatus Collierbacteria bacterium GW2011_GWE2_42_48]KKS63462.1 MAG: hypothetical protein UV29_C0001G0019 [Candidatus Collierbacteria bacterium GW2011_GWD2_42_50]KKS64538.1 MAG: hypothetical protein UV32_C0012G0022 [Candidatus Collierbacteria bacterium GW2011_GWF2_42_51]HAS69208.1 hypothetical protein [Candidatus Collierbacteria bacterium]
MKNNLFSLRTSEGKLLYRIEGHGYCFYSVKAMRFFFLDKITGFVLLNHHKTIDNNQLQKEIENALGYPISDVIEEIKRYYLNLIPKTLLIS